MPAMSNSFVIGHRSRRDLPGRKCAVYRIVRLTDFPKACTGYDLTGKIHGQINAMFSQLIRIALKYQTLFICGKANECGCVYLFIFL